MPRLAIVANPTCTRTHNTRSSGSLPVGAVALAALVLGLPASDAFLMVGARPVRGFHSFTLNREDARAPEGRGGLGRRRREEVARAGLRATAALLPRNM